MSSMTVFCITTIVELFSSAAILLYCLFTYSSIVIYAKPTHPLTTISVISPIDSISIFIASPSLITISTFSTLSSPPSTQITHHAPTIPDPNTPYSHPKDQLFYAITYRSISALSMPCHSVVSSTFMIELACFRHQLPDSGKLSVYHQKFCLIGLGSWMLGSGSVLSTLLVVLPPTITYTFHHPIYYTASETRTIGSLNKLLLRVFSWHSFTPPVDCTVASNSPWPFPLFPCPWNLWPLRLSIPHWAAPPFPFSRHFSSTQSPRSK